MIVSCPNCKAQITDIASSTVEEVVCGKCLSQVHLIQMLSMNQSMTHTKAQDDSIVCDSGTMISHFEIGKQLGTGGFGSVYSARDHRLDREVAIKLPRMAEMSPKYTKVFVREAQAAAQLNHPNIVSVFEVGREGDQVFIVSELVRGETLNVWLSEEKPDPIMYAKLLAKISRALHAAHQADVIHRDVKPRNIVIDHNNEPHITDFGLAKRVAMDDGTIIKKGQVVGTPGYMSPEQALGKAHEADCRTDVYSLGVMLYEALLGYRPYRGKTDVITEEIIRGDVGSPLVQNPNLNPDIAAICAKAMACNPDDRYASALELAQELERYAKGLPIKTRPISPLERSTRFVGRNRLATVVCLSIIGLLSALIYKQANPGMAALVEAPKTILVDIDVNPANAIVRIAKVDHEIGYVDLEHSIVVTRDAETGKFQVRLEPGFYIVEAEVENHGVVEVRRRVELTLGNRYSFFTYDRSKVIEPGEHIRWHKIEIPRTPLESLTEISGVNLTRIKGEKFDATAPSHKVGVVKVDDFLVGDSEVTVGQYRKVMGELPLRFTNQYHKLDVKNEADIPNDASITNISYGEALEFCERTGTRLLTLNEYLLIATNGGTTKYPWGNQAPDDWSANWGVNPTNHFPDNVLRYPTLSGFYSSQLEWTQEFKLVVDGDGNVVPSSFAGMNQDPRVVVDGPSELIDEVYHSKTYDVKSSSSSQPTIRALSNVGFRVAKSLSSRLKPDANKKTVPAK